MTVRAGITGLILVCTVLLPLQAATQTVGIGIDIPTATLDIRSVNTLTTLNVNRVAPASVGTNAAVEVRDVSDYSVMEVYQGSATNNQQVIFISNAGRNNALWAANLNTGNLAATALFTTAGTPSGSALELQNQGPGNSREIAYAYHAGTGAGLIIELANAANPSDALQITHEGSGAGIAVNLPNAAELGIGALVNLYGDDQTGYLVNASGTNAWAMYNILEGGTGIYNYFSSDWGNSVFTDMYDVDGSGYSFANIDVFDYYDSGTVKGSGDGFALTALVNTLTPAIGNIVSGAVIGGDQFGPGHGILINHSGGDGRNAEFNILGSGNPDPAVYASSSGTGSALVARQENSAIGVAVPVAEFVYAGSEAVDHIAVYGNSVPANGAGVGGQFAGGFVGVYGSAGSAGALAAVYADGELATSATKPFIIDHPLDPENRYLRHFAMESNEVLNVYRGVAVLGRSGRATVKLPEYFDAINRDATYQLTAIGSPRQPWISREISGNSFEISGSPGSKVSWTVYANRNDAYVRANPERVTDAFPKAIRHQGLYADPASHGQDASRGIFFQKPQELEPMRPARPKNPPSRGGRTVSTPEAGRTGTKGHMERKHLDLQPAVPAAGETGPETLPRMEIRREIKTWDELR